MAELLAPGTPSVAEEDVGTVVLDPDWISPLARSPISLTYRWAEDCPAAKLSTAQLMEIKARLEQVREHGLPVGVRTRFHLMRCIAHDYNVSFYPIKKMWYRMTSGAYSDRMHSVFEPDRPKPWRMPRAEYLERRKAGTLPRKYKDGRSRERLLRRQRERLINARFRARLYGPKPKPPDPQLDLFD